MRGTRFISKRDIPYIHDPFTAHDYFTKQAADAQLGWLGEDYIIMSGPAFYDYPEKTGKDHTQLTFEWCTNYLGIFSGG